MRAATIDLFDEVDRHLVALASVGAPARQAGPSAPRRAEPRHDPLPRRTIPRSPSPRAAPPRPLPFVAAPPLVPSAPPEQFRLGRLSAPTPAFLAAAILTALGVGLLVALAFYLIFSRDTLTGRAAVDSVVGRIVAAESRGIVNAANKRSSATGPAQFIDDTWLEMIRAYRPDLTGTRNRDQLLALRSKPGLAHEMAIRFAERNAALLNKRQLPVTASTIYLAHFAGAAGAAALLTAPLDADAAKVMAEADSTGKTKREQIAKANPFLDKFTVADIRRWADRKMAGPPLVLTALLTSRK